MTADDPMPLRTSNDIVRIRQHVREAAQALGFGLVDQTKLVTAASEIARNTLIYGGGGEMHMERLTKANRQGLRLTFVDHGPGIANIELAMRDGFSTDKSLGLGLGGTKRLSDEFEIESQVGVGTRVSFTRWR